MTDQAETERRYRETMATASNRLLAALRREHPRIIAHLTRKQQNRSN